MLEGGYSPRCSGFPLLGIHALHTTGLTSFAFWFASIAFQLEKCQYVAALTLRRADLSISAPSAL